MILHIDQGKFHSTSLRVRDFFKNYKLKVIDNPKKTPEFAPIELLFNKWKKLVRHKSYDDEYKLIII